MTLLLERERELAELRELVAEASAGNGRLAVVEAPAGLGKTRLLQAVREAGAHAGMRVLSARGTELERDFPFALVRQLFEPALAALPAPEREALFEGAAGAARGALGMPGGSGEPPDAFAVLHGLYWLAAGLAERQPLLLAVDDAHWSDPASLDCLAFLLPRLDELPVLLAVACRPEEPDAPPSLARLATDTVASRLTPRALSGAGAAALLAGELGASPEPAFAGACHEASGGNPFLLCELARTLAAEAIPPTADQASRVRELAPERVGRTVELRLAKVPPQARAVAHALAVLGDDSDLRLVAALAGLGEDAAQQGADALRAAGVFDGDVSPRFLHPLVRNAVAAGLSAGERAAMHAQAAALLRERGASPQQLAVHLIATEPRGDRATVETLVAAGERAFASGAPRSAVACLMRALREPPPEDLRAAVLGPLLEAIFRVIDAALFDAIEADVFAQIERDPRLLCSWTTKVAPWLGIAGREQECAALIERAIEAAVGERDFDRAVQLEGQLIGFAGLPPDAARARVARHREHVAPGGPGERLLAAFDASWAVVDGDAATAAPLARRAVHDGLIFIEQSELLVPGEALRVLTLADQLDAAHDAVERAIELARERSATWDLLGATYLRAQVAFARGDLGAAQADVEQACGAARLHGFLAVAPTLTALAVTILVERGELAAAAARLAESGAASGELTDRAFFDSLLLVRGDLHLAQGRAEQAAEDLLELRARRMARGTDTSPFVQAGAHAARALVALGRREQALELAEEDLTHARRWGAPAPLAHALRARAAALVGAEAIASLEEAVAALDGSPAQLERAHALAELGAALRRANRRAEARDPLREGLALARRCGAAALAKRTSEELEATGEKVRRHTPIGVESLTPSERRVAELAASGMTNRQIAQTLFLTVKTIESHLAAAYDKLDIRSRRELPEALR